MAYRVKLACRTCVFAETYVKVLDETQEETLVRMAVEIHQAQPGKAEHDVQIERRDPL